MPIEMTRTRFQNDCRRFFYGNLLTQRLPQGGVPVYEEADEIVLAPAEFLDILAIPPKNGPKLSIVSRQERDVNLQSHMYGMMSLLLQKVGVTESDKQKLNQDCLLLGSTNKLLGLSSGSPLHSFDDRNTTPPSPGRARL